MAHGDHAPFLGAANGIATLDAGTKVPSAQVSGVLASTDLTNDAALEKVANKNAASGYAGLSAGSKIAASQISAVIASTDLTNDAALEKTANKGAASGYASLDGAAKVPSAQLTGVLASSDLTNDAALEKTANKGAASGYASLNVSSLVVQNPASASATPGAAIIPIADGGGDLDVGFVPDRVPRCVKVTKTFADFAFAGLTNDIEVFSLPAKGVIHTVAQKHTIAFSGGTIASYTTSVGISGNFTKYSAAFDVFQATGDTVFRFDELPNMENFGAATSIRAQAVATGDNLDQAVAGSVDFYIFYSVLP